MIFDPNWLRHSAHATDLTGKSKQDKCVTEEEYSKWREQNGECWNYIQPFLDEQGHAINEVLYFAAVFIIWHAINLPLVKLFGCLVWLWWNRSTTKRSNTYKTRGGILPLIVPVSDILWPKKQKPYVLVFWDKYSTPMKWPIKAISRDPTMNIKYFVKNLETKVM